MHLREKALVALAMGWRPAHPHLATCAACRQRLEAIRHDLEVLRLEPCPEPASDLAERVLRTAAVAPAPSPRAAFQLWPALAGAVALLALAVGIWSLRRPAAPLQQVAAPVVPSDRLLQASVARHLSRTQALLVELEHAGDPRSATVNLALETESARDLLASNRLFEQDAALRGDQRTAHLLDLLEPALIQIAHAPAQLPAAQWHRLQAGLAQSGVLFKVRVADQNLAFDGDL